MSVSVELVATCRRFELKIIEKSFTFKWNTNPNELFRCSVVIASIKIDRFTRLKKDIVHFPPVATLSKIKANYL